LKQFSIKTLCIAAFTLLAGGAQATGVDFEDLDLFASGSEFGRLDLDNTSVVSQGFKVAQSGILGLDFATVVGNYFQGATDWNGNGSNRLLAFNNSTITLSSAVSGETFSLSAFDGGESWVADIRATNKIQAVGYYSDGSTTTETFDLDLIKDPLTGMQTFVTNGSFTGLTKVEFTGLGDTYPEFSIDNMVAVVQVPEPRILTLMLVGLGATGLIVRRRRAG
jgi:hypothetical protein